MIEAEFDVISIFGIADEFGEADKLLVADIFEAMMDQFFLENQKPPKKSD